MRTKFFWYSPLIQFGLIWFTYWLVFGHCERFDGVEFSNYILALSTNVFFIVVESIVKILIAVTSGKKKAMMIGILSCWLFNIFNYLDLESYTNSLRLICFISVIPLLMFDILTMILCYTKKLDKE